MKTLPRRIINIPLLLLAVFAGAQETERVAVYCEAPAENLALHVPFTITLTIDHPHPDEVSVETPHDFNNSFTIEMVETYKSYMPDPASLLAQSALTEEMLTDTEIPEGGFFAIPEAEYKQLTVVKYTVIPITNGTLTLGQFKVNAAGRTGASWPQRLVIQNEPGSMLPSFRWRSPAMLTAGAEAFFTLELLNREDLVKSAGESFFEIESVPNAIIERLPASAPQTALQTAGAQENGAADDVLKLRIIPLYSGILVLKGSTRYNGKSFALPEKRTPISEGKPSAPPTAAGADGVSQAPLAGGASNFEPEAAVFDGWKTAHLPTRLAGDARKLWEGGHYAQTLALLRQNERDSFFSPSIKPLRTALERSLGFPLSPDEVWLPPFIFTAVLIAAMPLFFAALNFIARKNRLKTGGIRAGIPPGLRLLPAALALGAAFAAAVFFSKPVSMLIMPKSAVTLDTPVFPLPEEAENTDTLPYFREGERVLIRSRTKRFLYAHGTEARSGWVPAENIIVY
ncbi:MAG: hypothetical protein LBG72_08985 [Spirochaetaceae bacterium]|jgi:hypothetical protein|nr:hypothetical protein [Spirochaetaceae bacterium]